MISWYLYRDHKTGRKGIIKKKYIFICGKFENDLDFYCTRTFFPCYNRIPLHDEEVLVNVVYHSTVVLDNFQYNN